MRCCRESFTSPPLIYGCGLAWDGMGWRGKGLCVGFIYCMGNGKGMGDHIWCFALQTGMDLDARTSKLQYLTNIMQCNWNWNFGVGLPWLDFYYCTYDIGRANLSPSKLHQNLALGFRFQVSAWELRLLT